MPDTQKQAPAVGVAIITNSVPPYREHAHLRMARELPQIRLYTVCTHDSGDNRWSHHPPQEINPISFGPYNGTMDRPGLNLTSYRKGGDICRWIVQENIRAVVCLGYNDLGRVRVIRFCHHAGIPCFVWGDSNIRLDRIDGIKGFFKRVFVETVLSWATGAMPCGRYGKAYFEKYGMPPERIFLSPYEPDYDLIKALPTQKIAETQRRYQLDPNRRRLVFSGRLVRVKRVDLLIDAFTRIAAQRPQWDLLLIGDGPLRGELESRVPGGLGNRIQWTGFLDDQPTVSALYRLSDVLVLPSDYEPWALVVNEAAAAGLALVASDIVGAAPELISEGENGRTFPSGNLEALIAYLLEVTEASRIDQMKAASAVVLQRWRRSADPVKGLEQALRCSGVL